MLDLENKMTHLVNVQFISKEFMKSEAQRVALHSQGDRDKENYFSKLSSDVPLVDLTREKSPSPDLVDISS